MMKKILLLGVVIFGAAAVAAVIVNNQVKESVSMPEPVSQSGSSSQEQAKKLSTDSSITKDPNFINDVQKTQGIAKSIARKFGFLEHSSPEVDKLNGVYRSTYFDVPFVVIDTNIICALKLPMFFGITHIKDNSYRMSVWGMDGKAGESEVIISENSNGNLYIESPNEGKTIHLERID